MTEVSVVSSKTDEKQNLLKDTEQLGVKLETEVVVKQEVVECLVCLGRSGENCDLSTANTKSGTSLNDFLCKFTNSDLSKSIINPKFVCKTCLNLVNVLEQAETEYIKLREEFQSIINKNPLFDSLSQDDVSLESIKNECLESIADNDNDSEDEPLAITKKKRHRKVDKRKKKSSIDVKRKIGSKDEERSKTELKQKSDVKRPGRADPPPDQLLNHLLWRSWQCTECPARGSAGGRLACATHMLLAHTLTTTVSVEQVKKEESPDRSQTPSFDDLGTEFKVEVEGFDDDDDSSSYAPDEITNGKTLRGRGKRKLNKTIKKKKDPKVMHQCDQCNAKYTSLVRLEHHKLKHDDSKPPYICEVCGMHYKHKRACDIHVAMHKGISDWKCEECNKLFPSKGALQRHNNIHTGKLNYQCDLCGKSFIHTSSFKMHKLSHSGVKPHACDVCGLALMTRSHLKRHKRVHSGEKRHECPVCGKRFSERYNLVAHARSHAEGATGGAAPGVVAAGSVGVATGVGGGARRRLFRCSFCPERFERRYMLERHAGAAHGHSLERPAPTPRNTMSKLLKAQAQRRDAPLDGDSKVRVPESRTVEKLASQISTPPQGTGSWAGAYVAEFGLRSDYSH